jgi:methoxymalonate biosynthesis acyl carrier protein
MTDQIASTVPQDAEEIAKSITEFLIDKTKTEVAPDTDVFANGLVSSMFAMQLVVELESTFDIAIIGPDLKLDNFRTVRAMTDMVLRLRGEGAGADG